MTELHLLLVEDSPDDEMLLLHELRRGGYTVVHKRVETGEALRRELAATDWDLVISDYVLPSFSGIEALRILRSTDPDLPFIMVSGTIGEDVAVEALKEGAQDFVAKGRFSRLIPAIEREIREASMRRSHAQVKKVVHETAQRLDALFNQVAVGIAQLDTEGVITSANQRFCDITKTSRSAITGHRLRELAVDSAPLDEALETLIKTQTSATSERAYRQRSGASLWVSETLSPVVENGRLVYAVAIIQDISTQKRLETELRNAIAAREEFLSVASHELKTPITALSLQLESAVEHLHEQIDPTRTELEGSLRVAFKQTRRLTLLVNHLLDVTRLASGRYELEPEKLDLALVARDVVRDLQSLHRPCSIVVEASTPAMGTWDRTAIETIVTNLVSNAIKFGAEHPIHVTVQSADGSRLVRVADRGIGIAEEDQKRIFEQFGRAVSTKHYGGLGIGLWVVRALAEAHGGTVSVESQLGKGAVFTVKLPPTATRTMQAAPPRDSGLFPSAAKVPSEASAEPLH